VLIIIKIPVGISLIFAAALGNMLLTPGGAGYALSMISERVMQVTLTHSLSAVALFTLMGAFISKANLPSSLHDIVAYFFGKRKGGLTLAHVASSAVSLVAPLSVALVIYAYLSGVYVGRSIMSGLIPGVLVAGLFIIAVPANVILRPSSFPDALKDKPQFPRNALISFLFTLVLFFIVYGGLFFNWFRPTETAAIGAFLALIYAIASRQLRFSELIETLLEASMKIARVFLLIIGGSLFGLFMTRSLIIAGLNRFVWETDLSHSFVLLIFLIIIFAVGLTIDKMAALVILTPIVYPILISPIINGAWLGVLFIMALMVAHSLRPTEKDCLVDISENKDSSLKAVSVEVLLIACALIFIIPLIATMLPQMMFGW